MRVLIEPLLDAVQLSELTTSLQSQTALWEPGARTAGPVARAAKTNWQLQRETPLFAALQEQVVAAMLEHPLVRAAALPLRVHSVLFSRCEAGEGYGRLRPEMIPAGH